LGAGVGQRALEQLFRAGRLDLESFVHASRPALARGEKGIVAKQLKLLEQVVKRRPELSALVREVLSPALTHERPEIGEAAGELLERVPGGHQQIPELAEPPRPLAQVAEGTSAIVERAEGLLDDPDWGSPIGSLLGALRNGAPPSAWEVPVRPGKDLPPPITEPEEVVEAFTRLIESARDPMLIERAIAGAVRTARVPVEQRGRISAPLAKRAQEQLPGWPSGLTGADVRAMVASVAYTWSTGTRVVPSFERQYHEFALRHSCLDERFEPVTPTGVLAVRCIEAIDLIAAGAATELLAEPTHDRGAIDASAFIERAQKSYGGWLGPKPPRFDLEAAALRIRPGALDTQLGKLPRAVRDRLSALLSDVATWCEVEVMSGRTQEQWSKAGSLVVVAKVAEIGSRSTVLKRLTNLTDPINSYSRLSAEGEFATGYGAAIRTWPLIVPWLPELTAAHLLRPLSRAMQPGKHDHGPSAVGCLVHEDTSLGKVGTVALAVGCMGAEGDTRTAAGDVFAAAAKDGRLRPALMAEAWLDLAQAGAFQAKRLEATLRPVSTAPACGLRLAQTLQLALKPLLAAGVRDMHVLVRLAASLGRSYGVFADDPSLEIRPDAKPGTELAKALRALSEARSPDVKVARTASLDLLEGMVHRAEN
jgi:hypothetical protein